MEFLQGDRERRLAFYHAGTPYKAKTVLKKPLEGWMLRWREALGVPLLPHLTNLIGDIGEWHSFQHVLGQIAPNQRTADGPKDYN